VGDGRSGWSAKGGKTGEKKERTNSLAALKVFQELDKTPTLVVKTFRCRKAASLVDIAVQLRKIALYPSRRLIVADTWLIVGWGGRKSSRGRGENIVIRELATQEVEVLPCPEQRMNKQPLAGICGNQFGD